MAAVLAVVLLVFFRGPIGSGLSRFYGDSYDGLIEVALLEHRYGVLARGDAWNVTGYFFPYPDTIGYNDTDLVSGVPYALTRLFGGDPFVATVVAHMAMKAIVFWACTSCCMEACAAVAANRYGRPGAGRPR